MPDNTSTHDHLIHNIVEDLKDPKHENAKKLSQDVQSLLALEKGDKGKLGPDASQIINGVGVNPAELEKRLEKMGFPHVDIGPLSNADVLAHAKPNVGGDPGINTAGRPTQGSAEITHPTAQSGDQTGALSSAKPGEAKLASDHLTAGPQAAAAENIIQKNPDGSSLNKTADGRVYHTESAPHGPYAHQEISNISYDSKGHIQSVDQVSTVNGVERILFRQKDGTYVEYFDGKKMGTYDDAKVGPDGTLILTDNKSHPPSETKEFLDRSSVISDKVNGQMRPSYITDSNGNEREFKYDGEGNLTSVTFRDPHNGYHDQWVKQGDGTFANQKMGEDGQFHQTDRKLNGISADSNGTYTEVDTTGSSHVYYRNGATA